MSKTQFPLPKGVEINNIEIDVKNNLLTIVYEEEKSALEAGKWYTTGLFTALYSGPSNNIGFDLTSGEYRSNLVATDPEYWKLADMEEVKKLLIKEAEKRGFSGSFTIKKISSDEYVLECNFETVFNFKTGQWAEIVEEKKPLYVNAYGTEFLRGGG